MLKSSIVSSTGSCGDIEESIPIVIDPGNYTWKAGWGGDDHPLTVFNPIEKFGRSKDAITEYTIDDKQKIFNHLFTFELKKSPEEQPLLVSSSLRATTASKAKLMELLFETFKVPSLSLQHNPLLSLYSAEIATGLLVDSGFVSTRISPIHDGKIQKRGIRSHSAAGHQMDEFAGELFESELNKINFEDENEKHDTIQSLRHNHANSIAVNYEQEILELNSEENKNDNFVIANRKDTELKLLKSSLFKITESLFKPSLIGLSNTPGLPKQIFDSIISCEKTIQSEIANNIVIVGGLSVIKNYSTRVKSELDKLAVEASRSDLQFNIVDLEESKYSCWRGGSIVSSVLENWLSHAEYTEKGADYMHEKGLQRLQK